MGVNINGVTVNGMNFKWCGLAHINISRRSNKRMN